MKNMKFFKLRHWHQERILQDLRLFVLDMTDSSITSCEKMCCHKFLPIAFFAFLLLECRILLGLVICLCLETTEKSNKYVGVINLIRNHTEGKWIMTKCFQIRYRRFHFINKKIWHLKKSYHDIPSLWIPCLYGEGLYGSVVKLELSTFYVLYLLLGQY